MLTSLSKKDQWASLFWEWSFSQHKSSNSMLSLLHYCWRWIFSISIDAILSPCKYQMVFEQFHKNDEVCLYSRMITLLKWKNCFCGKLDAAVHITVVAAVVVDATTTCRFSLIIELPVLKWCANPMLKKRGPIFFLAICSIEHVEHDYYFHYFLHRIISVLPW